MDAIVTEALKGVKDGDIYPTSFAVGDVVSGDLARLAVEAGKAEYPHKAGYHQAPSTDAASAKPRGRTRKVDNDD